jgi:prephenate dehydrogenase
MTVAKPASDRTPLFGRVTVVGCGLIGGSIVKALRERTQAAIAAVDSEPVLRMARAWLDDGAPAGTVRAQELVAGADIAVLAMPVGAIIANLSWVLESLGTQGVATDTGSVKRSVLSAARSHQRGDRFVGGHPMTGRENSGFEAANSDLFEGARWFLVGDGQDNRTVRVAQDLVRSVGAVPVSVAAGEHDRTMAYASHAPQLIASALVAVAGRAGVLGNVGPGFRDMTRIAGGSASMWRDIFAANRLEVAAALADIVRPLVEAQGKLASGDEADLEFVMSLLDQARHEHDQVPGEAAPNAKEHE